LFASQGFFGSIQGFDESSETVFAEQVQRVEEVRQVRSVYEEAGGGFAGQVSGYDNVDGVGEHSGNRGTPSPAVHIADPRTGIREQKLDFL
jgi:hypothetical protein